MASVSLFVFFVLSHLVLLHSAEGEGKRENPYCRSFQCGNLGVISFPFTKIPPPSFPLPSCGSLQVECDEPYPMIHLPLGDLWSERRYRVINISHTNTAQHIRVSDLSLLVYLETNECENLDHFALPSSPFISYKLTTPNRLWTLFKCSRSLDSTFLRNFSKIPCRGHNIYYYSPSNEFSQNFSPECRTIQLPVTGTSHEEKLKLTAEFDIELHVYDDDCSSCNGKEGKGINIGITQKYFDAHTCTFMNMDINSFIFFSMLNLFLIHVLLLFLFHAIIHSAAIALVS